MNVRLFEIALFEAVTLFELMWPRLGADRLSAAVMATPRGRRARRRLNATVACMAVGGALTIALVPEDAATWTFTVLVLMSSLIGPVFVEWRRRAVVSLRDGIDAGAGERTPVLELDDERIPRAVWLIVVPPVATLALIAWLAAYWGVLEPRGIEVATEVAWRHPAFRTLAQFLFMDVGWCVWLSIYALLVWHGMARRYQFRRSQLTAAVADVWSTSLLTPAIALPALFRLPPLAFGACLLAGVLAVWLFVRYALPARRDVMAANMPPSSQSFYFDRNDPSAVGDRGLNLGSPWNWALFIAPAVFFMAPMVLFFL